MPQSLELGLRDLKFKPRLDEEASFHTWQSVQYPSIRLELATSNIPGSTDVLANVLGGPTTTPRGAVRISVDELLGAVQQLLAAHTAPNQFMSITDRAFGRKP